MKKVLKYIVLLCIIVLTIILDGNISEGVEISKLSYKQTKPEFYGTVGINLKVGDKLDLNNSLFRIFAKDFYDGDLTQKIQVIQNNVNMAKEGQYYIKYSVSNSRGNTSQISVSVIVDNDQERTIKRQLYGSEDFSNMDLISLARGNYHDRQNLGIYIDSGAKLKIRAVNSYGIKCEFINNEEIGSFYITNEWQTGTIPYDGVLFIKSSDIQEKITYQNSFYTGYNLANITSFKEVKDNSIVFANFFKTQCENEAIDEISVPLYNCNKAEIYIDTGNTGKYSLVKTLVNPSNTNTGYTDIKLQAPINIVGDKFAVAVRYTGDIVPYNYKHNDSSFTYILNNSTGKFELFKATKMVEGEKKYVNIPTIICKSVNKAIENPIIEINIEDVFKETSLIKPLDYYLYGDNQDKFFSNWTSSQNSYAVLENDRVTFLTPLSDKNKILKNTNYSHKNITEIFDMYNDIFKMYDSFVGLENVATESINQNVKTKYFIKADNQYSNKSAIAYYNKNNYVACVGNSIAEFFYINWTVLHEVAHGYDGIFRNADINLKEVINNVFAYYYQKQYANLEWMGSISENEKIWNDIRKNFPQNMTFDQISNNTYSNTDHYHVRLYMLINILDNIGPKEGMAKLYQNARKDRFENKNTEVSDLIAYTFSDVGKVNIIPYLESWHINISDDTKQSIEKKDYPIVYYIRDLVSKDETAIEIKEKLSTEGIYSLVSNQDIKNMNYEGIAEIKLTPRDYEKIKGQDIVLKSGSNIVKTVTVDSSIIKIMDMPIGVYELEVLGGNYNIDSKYIIVTEKEKIIEDDINKDPIDDNKQQIEDDVNKNIIVSPNKKIEEILSDVAEDLEVVNITGDVVDNLKNPGTGYIARNKTTKKNIYIIIVKGDLDGDTKIDFIGDIVFANNYRLGLVDISIEQKQAADIDGNGNIEFIEDLIKINNYRLGIIYSL